MAINHNYSKADFNGSRNHRGGYSRNDRIGYQFRPEKVHRNHSDFESLLKVSIKNVRRSK